MATLFLSYSHKDEEAMGLLETHLQSMVRRGLLESWHDRRIDPGSEIKDEISANLEKADIIALLVSPYFIASDYCYNVEMKRALDRHEAGSAVVIPIILEYCNWHSLPFGKLKATPIDGRPISSYPNRHEALKQVAEDIEEVVTKLQGGKAGASKAGLPEENEKARIVEELRSSNLHVKRSFTQYDKDLYLKNGFEFLKRFFRNSLAELEKRNQGIKADLNQIDDNHFICECLS